MKVLYIGQYTQGTTSKMRADILKKVSKSTVFDVIDTHLPFFACSAFWRSLGFRFKKGPLIWKTNAFIKKNLHTVEYDLIWVDKAVFVQENTSKLLRKKTKKLVHFTPDPAFTYHQSNHFFRSLKYYDAFVTTKSYELEAYKMQCPSSSKILYCTQGFDKNIHINTTLFKDREFQVAFLGRFEKEREYTVNQLINNKIQVQLAGSNWNNFAKQQASNPYLTYLGDGLFGKEYVQILNKSMFSIGFISKLIPELHTTRTFEIPACGCVLLTERNTEIESFYTNQEVIYYQNAIDLVAKIQHFETHQSDLESIAAKGYQKSQAGRYDYESIIYNLMAKILK